MLMSIACAPTSTWSRATQCFIIFIIFNKPQKFLSLLHLSAHLHS
jgi:hypothetical protein